MGFRSKVKQYVVPGTKVKVHMSGIREMIEGTVKFYDNQVPNDCSLLLEMEDEMVLIPVSNNIMIKVPKVELPEENVGNGGEKTLNEMTIANTKNLARYGLRVPKTPTKAGLINILNYYDEARAKRINALIEKRKKKKKK